MKLYYAPGVCSIGIHVLLEEIGKPYQAEIVNLRDGAQYKPAFTGINPKSKVPALERDDGSILTEFPVIATYLGKKNPQANLIPKDLRDRDPRVRGDGIRRWHDAWPGFRPHLPDRRFAPSAADQDRSRRRAAKIDKGFAVLDKALAGKNYLGGNDLSIADAAVFYVEFWGAGSA